MGAEVKITPWSEHLNVLFSHLIFDFSRIPDTQTHLYIKMKILITIFEMGQKNLYIGLELLKVTQKVSILYLLGKHYCSDSQHILNIFKIYTFESDIFLTFPQLVIS